MTNMTPRYEHFCQDSRCNYYHFLWRFEVKPKEMFSPAEKMRLEALKSLCIKKCKAYHFYKWQKEKGLTNLTSNFN